MNLFFSDRPGAHERHLRRKVNNPLFGDVQITQDEIQRVREIDEQELQSYMDGFHALAKNASKLDAKVATEVLIELKSAVEQSYEQSCGVMGSMDEIQQALMQLMESIMQKLVHNLSEDSARHHQLVEENEARKGYFENLQYKIIADLLRSESPITSDDLVPVLLSVSEKELQMACGLFTNEQLSLLCKQAQNILTDVDSGHPKITHARKMLHLMQDINTESQVQPQDDNGSLAS